MTSGDQKTGAGAALVAEETGVTKPQTLQKCISCVRSVRLLIRGMFCCVLDIQWQSPRSRSRFLLPGSWCAANLRGMFGRSFAPGATHEAASIQARTVKILDLGNSKSINTGKCRNLIGNHSGSAEKHVDLYWYRCRCRYCMILYIDIEIYRYGERDIYIVLYINVCIMKTKRSTSCWRLCHGQAWCAPFVQPLALAAACYGRGAGPRHWGADNAHHFSSQFYRWFPCYYFRGIFQWFQCLGWIDLEASWVSLIDE